IARSRLKRALQTASLVANELAHESPIRTDDALLPDAAFDQFRAMLSRLRKAEGIIVVGHNPNLTEFLSKTISGSSGAAQIEFKKGAVAKVEMEGRTGMLHWLVVPKIARVLQTSLKASSRPKTSRKQGISFSPAHNSRSAPSRPALMPSVIRPSRLDALNRRTDERRPWFSARATRKIEVALITSDRTRAGNTLIRRSRSCGLEFPWTPAVVVVRWRV